MAKFVMTPEAWVIDNLFEDSKFFLEEARKNQHADQDAMRRYIRASIITAFAAIEALLNTMLFMLEQDGDLELVERAFVEEKHVELTKNGYFDLARQHHFGSLEEKIRFLYWRREGARIPKGNVAWDSFVKAKRLRDEFVHPEPSNVSYSKISIPAADSCLRATLKIAQTLGWTPHNQT